MKDPAEAEMLVLVDERGIIIGAAPRSACHGDPRLLHQVVHCLVRNQAGDLLLQRRSTQKDVQPGKWDTSVGGHIAAGESVASALQRELQEEIGLTSLPEARFLHRYVHRNDFESELVWTFLCESEGPFCAPAAEIDELRFWSLAEIERRLGSGDFTPNFEEEYRRYRAHARGGE